MHDDDFEHEHEHETLSDADHQAISRVIREQETLNLLTVGIDIGSSTSHLLFARVVLQRQTHDLSGRFVVVGRRIVWRSPITFTPFDEDGNIGAAELGRFVADAYEQAGFTAAEVDSGAVILTGEAAKRPNARAIDELFASEGGKFVCATAGHHLESVLAAHGSGATALSARRAAASLHVDIGGGTTKLALIDRGEIRSVAAFAVGGRLLACDPGGSWTRVDEPARLVAADLDIDPTPAALAHPEVREKICARMAQQVVDQITGVPLDRLGHALELTAPLDRSVSPTFITFSGGVSEYIFGHESSDHGDIAPALAREIVRQLGERVTIPSIDPGQRIRATVIGASQYTVQVSGKTIHLSRADGVLPMQNVPVIHLGVIGARTTAGDVEQSVLRSTEMRETDGSDAIALAFTWDGPPSYASLRAAADGIMAAKHRGTGPLLLVIDGDVGQTLGRILTEDLGLARPLVSIDGVELRDLDYVDVGELLNPPGVVPVVIKSLLFS